MVLIYLAILVGTLALAELIYVAIVFLD
jgi:hypothetical protein